MEQLPLYVSALFMATTAITVFTFWKAAGSSKPLLYIILAWMAVQAGLALSGFLQDTSALPPRFLLLLAVPLITTVLLFSSRNGKAFLDSLDIRTLTLLHTIRIPVETVLFLLFLHKLMPKHMTFEGQNLDIISGLTAPLAWYFGFVRKKLSETALLYWNIGCLCILAVTVGTAILSAPTPFQQLAFDQPTRAILYFPFTWLAGTLVPIVYISHLANIRTLLRMKEKAGLLAKG